THPSPAERGGGRLPQAEFRADAAGGRPGRSRAQDPINLPAAFSRPHGREPAAIPKAIASAGSAAVSAERELDAGSAGVRVGDESASQFSREYSRLFGTTPPQRDVTCMRLVARGSDARRTTPRSTARGTVPPRQSTP